MIFRCILRNMNIPTSKNLTSQEKSNTPLLLLGIIFILTIGTSLLPASWFGIEQQTRRYEPLNLGSIAQPENLATDTNNDGAISWGELIASSLSLSPEETNDLQLASDPEVIANLNNPNNITASFTKNAFLAATALEQSGISDEASKQEVINQLLSEESQKITPKIYMSSDVQSTADSKITIKKYGNDVALILKDLITEKSITDELISITQYLEKGDSASLLPLVTNAKRAEAAIQKLLKVQVPESAILYQIIILNRVSEYQNMLLNLSVANTDAIRATSAMKNYQTIVTLVLRTYPTLTDYFNLKNVTFSSNEPGYIYVVGYTGITQ